MIPIRLQLRNFMCYGDNVSALELEGIKLACLSGDNGHGKSALLEAITWALWGKARAKSDDDLIFLGRSDVEVELDFELGGTRYRVIRKRSIRRTGKRTVGTPALELQVLGDSGWLPTSGNSVAETQRKINETLRMDYDTFINSAFLLQNRADEFTTKPPAERKRVLADILGLGQYDALEERAKEMARARENERRELAAALREIDAELAHKPEYESQLGKAREDVDAIEIELRRADEELRGLRERKQVLDLKATRLGELTRQARSIDRDLAQTEADIAAQNASLTTYQSMLERRDEILGACQRLEGCRERVEVLTAKLGQLLALNETRSRLDKEVQAGQQELVRQREGLRSRLSELSQIAQRVPGWRQEAMKIKQQLAPLVNADTMRDQERATIQSCHHQAELLKEVNRQLRVDMGALKERVNALGKAGATCPLCETEIGDEGRVALIAKIEAEGKQLVQKYRDNEARVKELDREAALAHQRAQELEQSLKKRSELERRAAVVEKSLADGEVAEGKVEETAARLAEIEQRLESRDYAHDQRKALAEVERQIADLAYDAKEHEALRGEVAALAHYGDLKEALSNAETAVQAGQEKLALLHKTRTGLLTIAEDVRARIDDLSREIAGLAEVQRSIDEAEARVDSLQRRGRESRERLGRILQMLGHCQHLEKQREQKVAAQTRASEEKAIYEELATAFGKNGIQAMIIDGALPEIEREANALLARMTDNRMHVSFETQREAKTSGGVIETLDINISDELGQRGYEMYSGGEAFRANFAIRIALSKLLAHRAGARLQTLIIDEGFGTQDSQGRDRLVECINSIADDFEKILVITHIQELKDAFPVRIDVVKTSEGSQIYVN